MTPRQLPVAIAGVLVLLAVVLQTVVVGRLPLPGAAPSLALAVVIALGMSGGQTFGAVAGFTAGLLLDVAPPAIGIVGLTALAYLIAGALAGRVRDPRGLAPVQLAAVVAGLAALAFGIQLLLGLALGAPMPPLWWLVSFVAFTTVLALPVVPVVAWLMRRAGTGRRARPRRRVVH